ncbi:MAG: aspartate kinase [Deltaproteobacteria bacterium]|nr:aspartate kinase [Deltaproteobacteria bacterium]
MPIVVQKYGGSSVADPAKIKAVAQKIADRRRAGYDVCVVVSAMGDTTDELLTLSKKVTENPQKRELDMLLTAGERISMALLSMALNDLGVAAISFTGSQSGIITNDSHTHAQIVEVRPYRVRDELELGKVVIVAGYQGVSYKREITTLGRGGSDTTAVAMAAALGAESCEIYSDVDGVFSADPRVVPQAKKLKEIAYEEMQELAEAGAKVLNAQAVEFARKAGIAIDALSTFKAGEGTRVQAAAGGARRVTGIAGEKEMVALTLRDATPASLSELCEFLDARGVAGQQLALAGAGATMGLPLENVHGYGAFKEALQQRFGERVALREGVGTVSAVGVGINADHAHLRRAISAIESLGVPVLGVHSSPLKLSLLVPVENVPECVRRLHEALVEG